MGDVVNRGPVAFRQPMGPYHCRGGCVWPGSSWRHYLATALRDRLRSACCL